MYFGRKGKRVDSMYSLSIFNYNKINLEVAFGYMEVLMAKPSKYPKEFRNQMARECYEQLLENKTSALIVHDLRTF